MEEERRTSYVAFTRAPRKINFIVAADAECHSPLNDELYHNDERRYNVLCALVSSIFTSNGK